MTPQQLLNAAYQLQQRWPDALIYPNPPPTPNGYTRNPGIPTNALAVDLDAVWPHECENDDDCNLCSGWYALIAWIDIMGEIHYTDLAEQN